MTLRQLLIIGLLLLLGGCGFHLRGAVPLPEVMTRTAIIAPANSALRYELESLLLSAGGAVVEQGDAASAVLTVQRDKVRSRTLSVDSLGRVQEYALTLTVIYSVETAKGVSLAEKLSSRVERDYRFDPDNVLAQGAERERVEQQMRRVAAEQMLRRIRTLSIPADSNGSAGSSSVTKPNPAQ